MEFHHVPVMLQECMEGLAIKPGGIYIDGTAGGAGHSSAIAAQLSGDGRLFAFDKDETAVETARQRLSPYPGARVVKADFRQMPQVLEEFGIGRVDGILLDLGVSSHQLDTPERGFSYMNDAPLDMRMGREGPSAYDFVNTCSAQELAGIFRRYGEEKFAMRIAKKIEDRRQEAPVETTGQLVEIIRGAIPAAARREGGHPAKRVFQALRIAVNGEMDSLEQGISGGFELLAPGGRFVVITFHSLEDRMVKQAFAGYCKGCDCPPEFPICICGKKPRAKLVNRKPVTASEGELLNNTRSKSAKLRVLEKL